VFLSRRFQRTHVGHEVRVLAQPGKLIVAKRVTDRISFFIGLGQVIATLLQIVLRAVHLSHQVVEVPTLPGGHQLHGSAARSLPFKNSRIQLDSAREFLHGPAEIFLREISCSKVAMEGGVFRSQLYRLLVFPDGWSVAARVIVKRAQVVVRLRVGRVQPDGVLVFLLGFAGTMQLEKADSPFIVQDGTVWFLPGGAVGVNRTQIVLLRAQNIALLFQLLRGGGVRRRGGMFRNVLPHHGQGQNRQKQNSGSQAREVVHTPVPSYLLLPIIAAGHGCGLGVATGFLSLLSSFLSSLEPPNKRPQKPFFLFLSGSTVPGGLAATVPGACAELVGALDTGEAGFGSRPRTLWKMFPRSPD